MAEIQWEKNALAERAVAKPSHRWKFLIAGLIILGAVAYLLFSSTLIGARYYVTVQGLLNDSSMLGKTVRVSGAVVGDPSFNPDTQELSFTVANIPNNNDEIRKQGGLAEVLHKAVEDPSSPRLKVVAYDKEIPDLLKNEAQAIMSGKLVKESGSYIFYADEITLKCPTRYSDGVPNQAAVQK
jgi:cytochrome c-type biogenesis protein CcmE